MVRKPKNVNLYNRVRVLRKGGISYRTISQECNTSKSNVSLWCKDIKLSDKQYKKLAGNRSWVMTLGPKYNHERREREINEIIESAKNEVQDVSNQSFWIAGAVLYWAEGAKTSGLSITNSDPRVILFMIRWFENIFGINIKERARLHLHIHQGNDEEKIKKYWSQLTGIPLTSFCKSFIKPKGTGHRTKVLPNGIIRLTIAGSGAENNRHKIMAWIEKISDIIIKTPHSSIGRAARS